LKSDTPLNRLVDSVAPESETRAQISNAVDTLIASHFHDRSTEDQIRAQLAMWRDNDARLQPVLQRSFLLQQVEPLSQELSALGAAGFQALDFIDKGQTAPADWKVAAACFDRTGEKTAGRSSVDGRAGNSKLVEASANNNPG
jgi:hexosaminidase